MILLESINQIIKGALLDRMTQKPVEIDFKCADYDGAMFHVSSSKTNKSEITISLSGGACKSLLENGGKEYLESIYGPKFIDAESGYDVSIKLTVDGIAEGDREKVATDAALLKSHLYGAPLIKVFKSAETGGNVPGLIDIPLRDSEERMWVRQDGSDRVTVLFSINFSDADDAVIGKVFLQEFKKSLAGAPSVDFNHKEAPLELKSVATLPRSENISYVTFVIFDRHFKGDKKNKVALLIPTFRNYLHYHIKCAKSYLHTRMRNRVELLLQVLNRAKQDDIDKEKKTATGRTFQRQNK